MPLWVPKVRVQLGSLFPVESMRKFNLLVGTIGGLFGGLLLSNRKLRKDLMTSKDPKLAAKLLGKELQRGGKEVAKEAKEWLESEHTQKGFRRLKHYFLKQWKGMEKEARHVAQETTERAKEYAGKKWG